MVAIRRAAPTDIPALGPVETSAAQLFATAPGLEWIARDEPMDQGVLARQVGAERVWVAEDEQTQSVVGFVVADVKDDSCFVVELSVHADWQRRGMAGLLIDALEDQGRREGRRWSSLTTYAHLPWNRPFYERRGYVVVDAAEAGPEHIAELAEEAKHGHDVSRRCVMRKQL